MKRLPDTELDVMKALWTSGPGTPRAQLDQILAPFGWSPNTINTYLAHNYYSINRDISTPERSVSLSTGKRHLRSPCVTVTGGGSPTPFG